MVPMNIDRTSTSPPAFSTARGVADETPSYIKLVICPANEMSRKHLAASAGFIKFCPSPPKSCFTTIIPKRQPRMTSPTGIVDGMLSAMRSPVTTALRSAIVMGFFIKNS